MAVLTVSLGALAIDHLVGTESDPSEEGYAADTGAFVIGAGIALVLTAFLFGVTVRRATRAEPQQAAGKALVCSGLAVATIPLLFLAVPFPFAGAAIALGLHARRSASRRVAIVALAVGTVIVVLGAAAYVVALVA